MTLRYAVTFEFLTKPPMTHRGIVAASTVGTCARRAIQTAQGALRPVNWSSLVFVALERLDVDGDIDGLADSFEEPFVEDLPPEAD